MTNAEPILCMLVYLYVSIMIHQVNVSKGKETYPLLQALVPSLRRPGKGTGWCRLKLSNPRSLAKHLHESASAAHRVSSGPQKAQKVAVTLLTTDSCTSAKTRLCGRLIGQGNL